MRKRSVEGGGVAIDEGDEEDKRQEGERIMEKKKIDG